MKKDGKISASEINKFAYCPYQWYYEKIYGSACLRKLYREQNPDAGKGGVNANFERGRRFHQSYEGKETFKTVVKWAAAVLIITAITWLAIKLFEL